MEAARPFVEIADKVVILSVAEDSNRGTFLRKAAICAFLAQSQHDRAAPEAGRTSFPSRSCWLPLVRQEADLLVMGGYGHSRVREVIFGGFTRHVLSGADLPILMAH